MPDRATQLARQILERMKTVASQLEEDGDDDETRARQLREEQVIKILASYAGVTDGNIVRMVTSALPTVLPRQEIPDRDRREFADFIRQHVRFETG